MKVYCVVAGEYKENCYIIVDEKSGETAVVDPGCYTEELKEALKNPEIKDIKYILITHGHYDHIFGVYDMKKDYPKAKVCIHSADAQCLEDERMSLADSINPGTQKGIKPDMNLKDGSKIKLGSIEFRVLHTPGHTPGCVCYLEDNERVMFSGDTLFCRTVGSTDFYRGNKEDMLISVKKLYKLEGDYTVYPGHSRATTLSEERMRNRYMRKLYK